MKKASDELELWNGLRAGNETALEGLYLLCFLHLLRYGMQLTHDNALTKEYINLLFARLWEKRRMLPEVASPKAYVLVSFKNLLQHRKESKASRMLFFPGEEHLLDNSPNNLTVENSRRELEDYENKKLKLAQALSSLSAHQKNLVVSRFILEKSYEEIAMEFQISIRTVYNSIHESLKILRSTVQREDFE